MVTYNKTEFEPEILRIHKFLGRGREVKKVEKNRNLCIGDKKIKKIFLISSKLFSFSDCYKNIISAT